jgi:ubiquinone/menaquinone biosynthesis C-methylase UbiE
MTSTIWATGDYPAVVTDLIAELGPILVDASAVESGQRVLDVAAGTGNVAIPAALRGAEVTASDVTPELLAIGERVAADRGAKLTWEVGDAQALPYADNEFDTVLSCVGVMFAPKHQPSADELVRVCKPGGRVGLINWTPEGFIGQMFTTMKPYAPPPPPGAPPPPLWGSEAHLKELFGDRLQQVHVEKRKLRVDQFATAEEFREYFKSHYGPTLAVYKHSADRSADLDRDLAELGRRFDLGGGVMEWEYLLFTAQKPV